VNLSDLGREKAPKQATTFWAISALPQWIDDFLADEPSPPGPDGRPGRVMGSLFWAEIRPQRPGTADPFHHPRWGAIPAGRMPLRRGGRQKPRRSGFRFREPSEMPGAGLELLQGKASKLGVDRARKADPATTACPKPRLASGPRVWSGWHPPPALDVSDGLIADLGHIAESVGRPYRSSMRPACAPVGGTGESSGGRGNACGAARRDLPAMITSWPFTAPPRGASGCRGCPRGAGGCRGHRNRTRSEGRCGGRFDRWGPGRGDRRGPSRIHPLLTPLPVRKALGSSLAVSPHEKPIRYMETGSPGGLSLMVSPVERAAGAEPPRLRTKPVTNVELPGIPLPPC